MGKCSPQNIAKDIKKYFFVKSLLACGQIRLAKNFCKNQCKKVVNKSRAKITHKLLLSRTVISNYCSRRRRL